MYVAITNSPSGKSESVPSSTSWSSWFVKDGSTAKPSAGTVTRPPMTPPRPSVAPSRKTLRGYVLACGAAGASSASTRRSGSTGGALATTSRVRSRTQRSAKAAVSTAPTATTGQLRTSPTRMHAIPTAKPIGHKLGGGRCGLSPG